MKNAAAALAKETFNGLKVLKIRINGHDKDLDILDEKIQIILTATNDKLYKTAMTLKIHYLAIKMQTKAFTAYMKMLGKYTGFCATQSNTIEEFLSALDALFNARWKHQIIDLVTFERYLKKMFYNLQRSSPNYGLSF